MANPKGIDPPGFRETDDNDNRSFKSISSKNSVSSFSSGSVSEDESPPPINFSTKPPASASLSNFTGNINSVPDLTKPGRGFTPQKLVTSISSDSSSSTDTEKYSGIKSTRRKSSDSDSSENDVEEYISPPPVPPIIINNGPQAKPLEKPVTRKVSSSSEDDVDEYASKQPVTPIIISNIITKPKPLETKNLPPLPSSTSSSDTDASPSLTKRSTEIPIGKSVTQPNRNNFSNDQYRAPIRNETKPVPVAQPVATETKKPTIEYTTEVQPSKKSPVEHQKRQKESNIFQKRPANTGTNKIDPNFSTEEHSQRELTITGTKIGSVRTDPTMDRTRFDIKPKRSYSNPVTDTSDSEGSTQNVSMQPSQRVTEIRKPREGELIYSWLNLNVSVGPQNKSSADLEKGGCFGLKKKPVSKVILQNVTGIVYPGQLVAMMGASGAGKTTLLNVLTFRNTRKLNISGDIFVNGVPVKNSEMLSSISAYVQQDDLFIGTLTVREHLIFQARLRMDRHFSFTDRVKRVDEVINDLGLTKCRDTLIGIPGRIKGISGGEMKRLSFASEVLTNPSLMFCDEPTSGLDSYMAANVISVLKQMAMRGKTIVCTIHQPSSEVYDMFDSLLLMAEGKVAYLGDAKQVIPFFKELHYDCPLHYNPADFLIQTLAIRPNEEAEICRKQVHGICSSYENSLGKKIQNSIARINLNRGDLDQTQINQAKAKRSPYKASWFQQFLAVFWRCWKTQFKDPMAVTVRTVTTIFLALLVGVIYLGQDNDQEGIMNINGALFLMLTNVTFQNVFGVVNVFAAELPVFLREHYNGMYRTDIYYLSKTFSELPFFIVLPFVFTSIIYWMIGMNPDVDRFFIACAIITLITNIACSFGYMISCLSSSLNMALAMGPPLIIPFLLFGGFFLNSSSVPVWLIWMKYISWFHYGNEALSINQWNDVSNITCNRGTSSSCISDGDELLGTLGFNEDNLILDCCMLVVLLIAFRIIGFLGLLLKTYRAK
ncbi:unnamed protein product [Allacma fusca]|uniref:Protein white n=1 Tax=Allacma fusca TaxID=39272 RepID=A0A8J2NQ75_9HEXA|nr:unnamed protein product [Allacma fusca]